MLIVQCLECKYLQNQHFKINNLNLNPLQCELSLSFHV